MMSLLFVKTIAVKCGWEHVIAGFMWGTITIGMTLQMTGHFLKARSVILPATGKGVSGLVSSMVVWTWQKPTVKVAMCFGISSQENMQSTSPDS